MPEANKSNPSLWWTLSWQLSLVILAVVAAVIIGLSVYGEMILSPNIAVEDKISAAVAKAVARDPQGKFQLRDTPELRSLKTQNKELWYVAATTDGASVSYGTIPASYAGLAHLAHLFQDADIRGAAGTNEIASVENVETAVGVVRILFGGFADKGWPVLTLLGGTYPIYIPLIVVALPAIFVAVPRIVRRALARVSDVARVASEIESRRHGARLPAGGIPEEVAPLVIAFNGTLQRLENEFKRRQRFLIDAAHELRTPIAIMQTRIEGLPEGQDRRQLLDDVARLGETAELLLDFERNDQVTDLNQILDLVDVARTVVADLAPLAIAAGYEISFQSEAESLERRGSPSALPRAIGNLVRNAIDHGGNAGMITVSVSADGAVSVTDEGPGIPPEHQELVFEPFYRVTPRSTGAGLGLSLVKQVAANHRAQVTLVSGSGGTRVTLKV